jgi:hypothetical protein
MGGAVMTDAEPYALSAAGLARLWGCSTRHIYDLWQRHQLGHIRIGGIIRIRQCDREAYEAKQWVAPDSTSPTTGSCSVVSIGMSGGGRTGNGSAFQRGRRSVARQPSG